MDFHWMHARKMWPTGCMITFEESINFELFVALFVLFFVWTLNLLFIWYFFDDLFAIDDDSNVLSWTLPVMLASYIMLERVSVLWNNDTLFICFLFNAVCDTQCIQLCDVNVTCPIDISHRCKHYIHSDVLYESHYYGFDFSEHYVISSVA